jgi:hypothetical protein
MFECRNCFGIRAVDDLVFLGQKPVPELPGRLAGLLNNMAQVIGVRWPNICALKISSESILELFPAPNGVFG